MFLALCGLLGRQSARSGGELGLNLGGFLRPRRERDIFLFA
jgi:hypothetical protein